MIRFTKRFTISLIAIAGLIFLTPLSCPATPTAPPRAAEAFPVHSIIRPNVNFWIDIFTTCSEKEGVIHDVRDLSRIYGKVQLNPAKTREAANQNRKTKKKAIKKYKAMLLKFSRGQAPVSPGKKDRRPLWQISQTRLI